MLDLIRPSLLRPLAFSVPLKVPSIPGIAPGAYWRNTEVGSD
jgi:hypothetical protein